MLIRKSFHCFCFQILTHLVQVLGEDCTWPSWSPSCGQPSCPPCDKVDCLDEISPWDCPAGSRLVDSVLLGCCPACVQHRDYKEECHHPQGKYSLEFIAKTVELPCSRKTGAGEIERVLSISWQESPINPNISVPVVLSPECYPDLDCDPQTKTCQITKEDCTSHPCTCARADYRLWYEADDCTERFWNPDCDRSTGLYSPVQLKTAPGFNGQPDKGEEGSYRWCSDPKGNRLYGQEAVDWDISHMTCSCSRKYWELQQTKQVSANDGLDPWIQEGRSDVSLHCDEKGNYEELQCDKGRCWCIQPKTGEATSIVLPVTLWHLLPCYTRFTQEVEVGKQYLRRCESRVIGIQNLKQWFNKHGTHWKRQSGTVCDMDGSFAALICDDRSPNEMCYCVDKNNQILSQAEVMYEDRMTCRCQRDKHYGMTDLKCDAYGNYKADQKEGDDEYCVDSEDGYRTSGIVHSRPEKPCCIYQSNPPVPPTEHSNTPWMNMCAWIEGQNIIDWLGRDRTECGELAKCKKGQAINGDIHDWTCHPNDGSSTHCNEMLKECRPT